MHWQMCYESNAADIIYLIHLVMAMRPIGSDCFHVTGFEDCKNAFNEVMRAKIAENTEQFFADEGNLFALDHEEATDIILHGRHQVQEVTEVYHNEEGTKQGHVLATEGYNRGTYVRGRIGHALSTVRRLDLVQGGVLHPGTVGYKDRLDKFISDTDLRDTHAHLGQSVYTVPVVQTLYVDDGTSSEDSGTFLATEAVRTVTAAECGMERNLSKTRFYGKTDDVDELVELATIAALPASWHGWLSCSWW